MCKLETGIYCAFWNEILDRFNATNKILQAPTLDLNNAVASVKSLKCFIDAQRDGFSMFEKKGKIISKSNEYNDNKKRSRKLNIRLNPLDYGKGPDSQLNHSEKFKVECFLPVIDQMPSAISQRLKA